MSDDARYEECFDRFEYLYALVYADMRLRERQQFGYPVGRYGWRRRSYGFNVLKEIEAESDVQGASWPPLKAGLFGGSFERFDAIRKKLNEELRGLEWLW